MHATTPSGGGVGGRWSKKVNIALTVPKRALTGCPSAPTIDFGSAKYERYSSHGTAAISSGAGTSSAYASSGPHARQPRQPASIQQFSVQRKRFDASDISAVGSAIVAQLPRTTTTAEEIACICERSRGRAPG